MSVAVLGAGIMGLSTATLLQEKDSRLKIHIITADESPGTTSDLAAGYWRPFVMKDPRTHLLKRWGEETFMYTEKLIRDCPEAGAGYQAGYEFFNTVQESPYWEDTVHNFKHMNHTDVRKVLGPEHPDVRCGFSYASTYVESKQYLPYLLNKFRENGGTIETRKLRHLDDVGSGYDVIVNCTGLGSYFLFGDTSMYPVRGQVLKVHAPQVKMFYNHVHEVHYILLNDNEVTVGGTAQVGNWDTTVNPEESKRMWENCVAMCPSLRYGKVLREAVGLRPGRPSVRLESEAVSVCSRPATVVHNYGHGGSGITFFYGCSNDAAQLAKEAAHRPARSML